jgi:hypothetical protein
MEIGNGVRQSQKLMEKIDSQVVEEAKCREFWDEEELVQ